MRTAARDGGIRLTLLVGRQPYHGSLRESATEAQTPHAWPPWSTTRTATTRRFGYRILADEVPAAGLADTDPTWR